MSVQLDPKNKPIASSETKPKCNNLLHRASELACLAFQKAALPCQRNCERKWTEQTGMDPSQATEAFMKPCMKSCEAIKAFRIWSQNI